MLVAGCSGGAPTDTVTDTQIQASNDSPEPQTTANATEVPSTPNGTFEMHYINVGQSVSTLLVGPNCETMLIDTGHYHDDGEYVLEYLQAHGIDRIDHLVVSHNDADHIGGNAAIIKHYETEGDRIGAIYDPGIAASTQTYSDYLDAVEEHDVTLYETREGDSIDFGGSSVDVNVLGPPEPYIEDEARNENSIVLHLSYGQTSFLLTGDAEDDQEAYLVSNYGNQLNTTVMKAGHHGSASSTSGQLLDAVQPEAVVISSAFDSQYGHPTEEALQRLADRSIPALWTATHGNIVLISDGRDVSVRTQQDGPTNALSVRDGDPIEPGTNGDVQERLRLGGGAVSQPVKTTVATDGGSIGNLVIEEIHADAEGDERENLNDEYVVFANAGGETLDLSGWTVEDETGATYTFPDGFTIEPNASVTLHTGSGTDTAEDLYWNSGSPIWNNGGDTVIVRDHQGTVVVEETYS